MSISIRIEIDGKKHEGPGGIMAAIPHLQIEDVAGVIASASAHLARMAFGAAGAQGAACGLTDDELRVCIEPAG